MTDTPMPGKTIDNPIPLNTTVHTTVYVDIEIEISILEIQRGENPMSTRNADKAQFPVKPQPGKELLAALVAVTYIKGSKDTFQPNTDMFQMISDKQVIGIGGTERIQPALIAELLPGGKTQGWITFWVFTDDPNPVLQLEHFSNGLYFATH